jgi:histidinol phosphatase-like PHP family hydrolase
MTRRRRDPLLCELHAHTRWSDVALSIRELVDLYGRNGFDVLCVTDHLVRVPEGMARPAVEISARSYDWYLEAIEIEAARALLLYDLLVIPGSN